MMPKRLVELDSGATEVERSLLASSESPDPGPGEQERVWQLLAASLANPTPPGTGDSPAGDQAPQTLARASDKSHPLVNMLVNHGIGFAAGVVVTTLAFLTFDPLGSKESPAPTAPAITEPKSAPPIGPSEPPPGVPTSTTIDELEPEASDASRDTKPSRASRPAPAGSEPTPQPISRLSEEAALIRESRSRLAHGDLAGAAEVLALSKRRFPASLLEQEREAVTIELLRRQGETDAAARRARQFLAKYPRSPHARQVERALPATTHD